MIKSFRCKDTEALYQGKRVRKFESCQAQAEKRLEILDNAKTINDLMALTSNCFEAVTAPGNAASASICNGVYVLNGKMLMLTTWRLLITTKGE